MPSTELLIVNADVGVGPLQQIAVGKGRSGASVVTGISSELDTAPGVVIDADGCAVITGIVDHHVHLFAMAAAMSSVTCGPPTVHDRTSLHDALAHAEPDDGGWIRGVGYVETVAGDLTREALDAMTGFRPTRVQHRSGALWMLNTAAIDATGLAQSDHPGIERSASGEPTGRLWRADSWLRSRLPPTGPPDLAAVGRVLADHGITEITDATPDLDDDAIGLIKDAVSDGTVPQRVLLLGAPLTDRPAGSTARISFGPYKIVLADSALVHPDALASRIKAAHAVGRSVAIHSVSYAALAIALAAWGDVGVRAGDRIEHAGMVSPDAIAEISSAGLIVVTQPGFLPHRGDDFLDVSDDGDHNDLYRCGSLIAAGVPVALSSDAPFGPIDPWNNIAAAVHRRTATGRTVGASDDRISALDALALYQKPARNPGGHPRRIAIGQRADLVVLDRPMRDVLADPSRTAAVATIIDGRRV